MAVTTAYEPLLFSGNGSTVAFSITWPFFEATDLRLFLIDSSGVETLQTLTTHYTVSGGKSTTTGLPGTGTVTMLTAPATGSQLRIQRETSVYQQTTWSLAGQFSSQVLEAELDRRTLVDQERAIGGTGIGGTPIDGTPLLLETSGASDYWDGKNYRIGNVATPTLSTDAVNYATLQSFALTAGSGDVVGPVGAVDGQLVMFDGVTGKLVKAGPAMVANQWIKVNAAGTAYEAVGQRALSSNDYDDIAAMVTAARAAGIGECWVEPATVHEIDATITLNGVRLRARKPGQHLRFNPGSLQTRMFHQTSADTLGCGLYGFLIELNNLATYGIDFAGVNGAVEACEMKNTDVLDGTICYPIQISPTAKRVRIANNYLHNAITIIRCQGEAEDVQILYNWIEAYRHKGINILTQASTATPARGPILVKGNYLGPGYPADPANSFSAKQPIAVNQIGSGTFAKNVHVVDNNLVFDKYVPHADGLSNTGTADAISFHRVFGGSIVGNSVINSGEVGINLSLQCSNILIANNLVEYSDLVGINVGSGTDLCQDVTIVGNHMRNCGVDQLNEIGASYSCGVRIHNSDDCRVISNTVSYNLPDDATITGATQADPVVITTSSAHGLASGAVVRISSVGGMTELNGNRYRVTVLTSTTFSLQDLSSVDINGTGFTAYTSGGTVYSGGKNYGLYVDNGLRCFEKGNAYIGVATAQVAQTGTCSFDWTDSKYTTAGRVTMTSAAAGSVIWNTTTTQHNLWNGSAWKVVIDEDGLSARITSTWKYHGSFAVASLPTSGHTAGDQAFATDGRKNGEGAGLGTGVTVFYDGTNWKAVDTGATVAA